AAHRDRARVDDRARIVVGDFTQNFFDLISSSANSDASACDTNAVFDEEKTFASREFIQVDLAVGDRR
ncbi:MAG: hypothetical protein ACKOQX_07360, partial [Actinomycetota bacterium]